MKDLRIIDWEPPRELFEHYQDKTLVELMELYDASVDKEEDVINQYDYDNVPLEIAMRLKMIPIKVANECLKEEFSALFRKLNELEAITKKHRHKTLGGLYTEKPAW